MEGKVTIVQGQAPEEKEGAEESKLPPQPANGGSGDKTGFMTAVDMNEILEMQALVADLTSRLKSAQDANQEEHRKFKELSERKRELEARLADLEKRIQLERKAKEEARKERDQLNDSQGELEARVADLENRFNSERETRLKTEEEAEQWAEQTRGLGAKVAELSARLQAEKTAREALQKDRDKAWARTDEIRGLVETKLDGYRQSVQAHFEGLRSEQARILEGLAAEAAVFVNQAAALKKVLVEGQKALEEADKAGQGIHARLKGTEKGLAGGFNAPLPPLPTLPPEPPREHPEKALNQPAILQPFDEAGYEEIAKEDEEDEGNGEAKGARAAQTPPAPQADPEGAGEKREGEPERPGGEVSEEATARETAGEKPVVPAKAKGKGGSGEAGPPTDVSPKDKEGGEKAHSKAKKPPSADSIMRFFRK